MSGGVGAVEVCFTFFAFEPLLSEGLRLPTLALDGDCVEIVLVVEVGVKDCGKEDTATSVIFGGDKGKEVCGDAIKVV